MRIDGTRCSSEAWARNGQKRSHENPAGRPAGHGGIERSRGGGGSVLDQERRRHVATTVPYALSRAEPSLPSYRPIRPTVPPTTGLVSHRPFLFPTCPALCWCCVERSGVIVSQQMMQNMKRQKLAPTSGSFSRAFKKLLGTSLHFALRWCRGGRLLSSLPRRRSPKAFLNKHAFLELP